MNLLLIDGNNLAHRVHWTHKHLSRDNMPVSVLYGFFRSLVGLKRKFPDRMVVVAWDGGYTRRLDESRQAMAKGLIPSVYKSNRPKFGDPDADIPPHIQNIHIQMPSLKEALKFARVMQVYVDGVEADDVICTYCATNPDGNAVVVTSDHDYYQIITKRVAVYDAMKQDFWTYEKFTEEYGFEPRLWVDVGAMAGDTSDEIHGVPGIGEVYATKFVKQYGDIDSILAGLRAKVKLSAKETLVIEHEERMRVAKSLKAMDCITGIPAPKVAPRKPAPLIEWFKQMKFDSLAHEAWRLCE